jgi:uncharacterized protein (DUF2336 family)
LVSLLETPDPLINFRRRIIEALAMPDTRSLLQELDDAIVKGSAEGRERALWHATNLLIAGRYSENEICIFGEAIERLAADIEVAARARLSNQLAHTNNAPARVVGKLAFDDSIDVTGPVLRHSECLDAQILVANIRCKSQDHLLAISKREGAGGQYHGRTGDARQSRSSALRGQK